MGNLIKLRTKGKEVGDVAWLIKATVFRMSKAYAVYWYGKEMYYVGTQKYFECDDKNTPDMVKARTLGYSSSSGAKRSLYQDIEDAEPEENSPDYRIQYDVVPVPLVD